MRVSVIGAGKLGLPMMAAFASKGMQVTGIDINGDTIRALNQGECPVRETNLDEYLVLCRDNLKFTTDFATVEGTEITFIIVPTPSENGVFTNKYVLEAIKGVLPYQDKLICITSTLMPNSMRTVIAPFIKEATGKVAGEDVGLCYNPEFIALGSVIENILHPDSILIGESDKYSGETLARFYNEVCGNVPICRMSWENAECAKLMLNVAVTAKISLANTFAYVCENVKGGNVDDITHFIGLDARIGAKYLKGGAAFGGPCLPPETLVQTNRGLVRIDAISTGDCVISHDGEYHPVTRVFKRNYTGDLVKIIPEGFPSCPLLLTPDHPVFAAARIPVAAKRHKIVSTTGEIRLNSAKGYGMPVFITAKDLAVGDKLLLPKLDKIKTEQTPTMHLRMHHLSHVVDGMQVEPEMMRFFGYYLSEGSTWGKEIKFSFHKKEETYINDVVKLSRQYFSATCRVKAKGKNGADVVFVCAALADYLRNTFGLNCYEKHVPHEWLFLPNNYTIELLRGIWYGDGSISGNRYTLGITSKTLTNQVRLILLNLGIAFTTKTYLKHTGRDNVTHQEAYHTVIGNPPYVYLMSNLLPEMQLNIGDRFKKSVQFEDGMMTYHIKSIEQIPYSGDVCNLEIEGANSYMLENSVVHNCFPRDNLAFAKFCESLEIKGGEMSNSITKTNTIQNVRLNNMALTMLANIQKPKVVVLGLAYKPGTVVTEESAGMKLVKSLKASGVNVVGYDAEPIKDDGIAFDGNLMSALLGADLAVIALPNYKLSPVLFKQKMRNPQVLDCWRTLKKEDCEFYGVVYKAIGLG